MTLATNAENCTAGLMKRLQFIILGYSKGETDPECLPCVLCLRSLDQSSWKAWVYIDESYKLTMTSPENQFCDWANDFYDALAQMHTMQPHDQDKRFSELCNLSVGPIRTIRSGTIRPLVQPDSSLEFRAALQSILSETD